MSETVDCVGSRFTSILKLERPLSPLNVNTLQRRDNFLDKEGAVALIQYIFLEDIWKSFFKCLANNVSKPLRTNEEAFEMAKLEQERDALAREHYVLRKKNARANTLIEKFQGNFQVIHDKQSKAASEIYSFAEKLRGEHLESKEKMSNQIRDTTDKLEQQRKANSEMLKELKALQDEVASLSKKFERHDLNNLDRKIEILVRGSRLSNV